MGVKPGDTIGATFALSRPSTGNWVAPVTTPDVYVLRNGVSVAAATVELRAFGRYYAEYTVPSGWSAGDLVELLAYAVVEDPDEVNAEAVVGSWVLDSAAAPPSLSMEVTEVRT